MGSKESNTILGIDIGYSNLKLAIGKKGETPKTILRPAGAAPVDRFGFRFDGKEHSDLLHVMVDNDEFIAGVSSDRAEMWTRSLHADYTSSPSYKALFHAGLLLSEFDHIDTLVTGLPVNQFMDESRKKKLTEQMLGTHQVTKKRSITVNNVKVIPQPVGGLLDHIAAVGAEEIEDARILVVDPGFFSVDWVVIANHDLNRKSSGTSHHASSIVLEEAAKLLAKDYGANISIEVLENAVRNKKDNVMVLGQRIEYMPYIDAAMKTVGSVVVETIQKSLRTDNSGVDMIVLVGGGSIFFKDALSSVFNKTQIITPSESVFANARGFWYMGAAV
jgi:plasmid segregation protein ParM